LFISGAWVNENLANKYYNIASKIFIFLTRNLKTFEQSLIMLIKYKFA